MLVLNFVNSDFVVVLFEALLFVIEPLHTTEDSCNAGIADCSDQSKQVLHYAQSAMVVESLNKEVSYLL
jgi:hypothetical protein